MLSYERNMKYWDDIFNKVEVRERIEINTGNDDFDEALDWLCTSTNSVLDFGCGSGSLLFKCLARGTKEHTGIDLSLGAVNLAKASQKSMKIEGFTFMQGGVDALAKIPLASFDGVILSNIIDNLIPADALRTLTAIKGILKKEGKILVKLNSHLSQEKIEEWKIKVIEGNFLDDGLFLWNQTSEEWHELFAKYYIIHTYKVLHFKDYQNRLFLLENSLS